MKIMVLYVNTAGMSKLKAEEHIEKTFAKFRQQLPSDIIIASLPVQYTDTHVQLLEL